MRKLRARDGFGFFKQGNNRMGQLVLAAIEKERKAPLAPAPATVALRGATSEGLPSFGRSGLDGENVTLSAQQMTEVASAARAAERNATKIAAGAAPTMLAIPVVPGSAADKLFYGGTAPAPLAGRFDDFSMPSTQ